jgi:hypothetical protein
MRKIKVNREHFRFNLIEERSVVGVTELDGDFVGGIARQAGLWISRTSRGACAGPRTPAGGIY